jgi:hypothetical protein
MIGFLFPHGRHFIANNCPNKSTTIDYTKTTPNGVLLQSDCLNEIYQKYGDSFNGIYIASTNGLPIINILTETSPISIICNSV